ncbi:MAG: hypothetical protein HZB41_02570 [Ignavibacteriae bacterium]|nr:hypothetical protein [Ignavibacteriota bacterium]
MFRKLNYLFFIVSFFILIGCTSNHPECINDGNKELKIRWGTFNSKTGRINGYQLNNNAGLSRLIKSNEKDNAFDSLLFNIDENQYCNYLGMIRDTILKIQALSEPGDSLHFIEYTDAPRNVRMRALWNPVNKTFGSKGFRAIYDSLQAIVKVVR